jgi:hypothetical protein
MNIALWLERHGLATPDAPALGYGAKPSDSYGDLA